MLDVWDQPIILCAPRVLKWFHFFCSAIWRTHNLSRRFKLAPLHMYCILWHWYFQNAGVSASSSSVASLELFSWPLTLPHDAKPQFLSITPSILGRLCNWGCAFASGLSGYWTSASLYDPLMPSKLVPPERILYITRVLCQHKLPPWPLWITASVRWPWENIFQISLPWRESLNHSWCFSSRWPAPTASAKQIFHVSAFGVCPSLSNILLFSFFENSFFLTSYVIIMVSPPFTPPSSLHLPSHLDPLLFCLSLENKQLLRDNGHMTQYDVMW